MKYLSLIATVITVLISSFSFAYAISNAANSASGGTITITGAIYEPLCNVRISNSEKIDLICYRNGQNLAKTSSLKNAKTLSSNLLKMKYSQFNNKPTLNINYN
ncbi:hypothetical protein M5X66_01010 [Providencia sp. PROV188]|uniref:hypothetical protein n=1 Tax=unclassified Providencia TaxID=2633465 RepID=UPI0012B5F5B0|nr:MULTISPECIES: hypothetical protein [unclassified Providencia]MTB44353.1 hypothetical protein [Providencia sp. wls1950]MTC23249.1 hypothetical protein [Providencia sp. wls1938]MTC47299.1 hypothetical protein [Providencia sp. wls1922]MTC78302.1 hypothetical protein [Providencia sp. wls1916]WBM60997.1 hypothetical protein M5X66_01010 [Providencia sp. PROV188]